MREIKFRGKRVNRNEWVYGYLLEASYGIDKECIYDTGCIIVTKVGGEITMCEECGFPENVTYDIIPKTIGEYTGLKDKNGKEIYEGDIMTDGTIIYAVDLHKGAWRLKSNIKGDIWWKSLYRYAIKCTVIGNAFDNPELLKE